MTRLPRFLRAICVALALLLGASATPVRAAPDSGAPGAAPPEIVFPTDRGLRFADVPAFEAGLAAARTVPETAAVLRRFGDWYGIDFAIQDGDPGPEARRYATWRYIGDADAAALRAYAALFLDEWAKYPRAWVRSTGLRTIFLVTRLSVVGQARYAMPDPDGRALYLQVAAPTARRDDYLRGVLHHEFDHCIEHEISGEYGAADPDWTLGNPPGFHYGDGGASAYNGKFHNDAHPAPGFVTAYALTAIEEDKAEVYAWLFVTERYRRLLGWSRQDPGLAAKTAAYRALLRRRVPLMTDACFAAIHALPDAPGSLAGLPSFACPALFPAALGAYDVPFAPLAAP